MSPFPPRRCVWFLLAGLAGCNSAPPAVPTPATPATTTDAPLTQPGRPPADKPDLLRLSYDPSAHTLTLYDLPDRGGRWQLVTPDHPDGTPVSGTVTVPDEPDAVCVFFTVPDRRPSPRVTLREIAEARTYQVRR